MFFRLNSIKKSLLSISGGLERSWKRLPNGLYCFNYHRIGDSNQTSFDPNVFSCDTEHLDMHIKAIKDNFEIISIRELCKLIESAQTPDKRYALLTFDDGYYDNYSHALPVLKRNRVSAVFYLTTELLDNQNIPWWDEIAWYINHTQAQSLDLGGIKLELSAKKKRPLLIREIIHTAKTHPVLNVQQCLELIKQQLSHPDMPSPQGERLFMNWDEAKSLVEAGMEIGSHTVSHNILAQQATEQQKFELEQSRHLLESRLGCEVLSIAYPVGNYDCFTKVTCQIAERAGYQVGFSNVPGNNQELHSNRFGLLRSSIHSNANITDLMFRTCYPVGA